MPLELHFLGWDALATTKVREFLLPRVGWTYLEQNGWWAEPTLQNYEV
jgi:hypothetical protein